MKETQPKTAGQPKVAAAGLTGAITVVLVWALQQAGLTMPGEVAAATTVIIMTLVAYFKRG